IGYGKDEAIHSSPCRVGVMTRLLPVGPGRAFARPFFFQTAVGNPPLWYTKFPSLLDLCPAPLWSGFLFSVRSNSACACLSIRQSRIVQFCADPFTYGAFNAFHVLRRSGLCCLVLCSARICRRPAIHLDQQCLATADQPLHLASRGGRMGR